MLSDLQDRFDVQFNYVSKLVDNVTISSPPDNALSLKESLQRLSEQTALDFVVVSKKIISIKRKKKLLCGYLKDKDTGEVLPFVTVQNGTGGTISNKEGFFELELSSGNDIIQIRHIGHKPIRREARYFNTSECGTLYLIPILQQLAGITLYDFLIRGIDKLDNGAFQLNFNKFSILPGLIEEDVLQSVQALPGIQSVDETVSNINIRGGSNDQNLITWDAIKMYQSGHFFGLISMYNPSITQKVALQKNGSSVSQTDGVSGTIRMQTDSYVNPSLKGNFGINLIDAKGFVDTPLGQNASLQLALRKSISNFVETPTYSEYFDRIAQGTEIERNTETVTNSDIVFDFYDTSMRLLYHPSDNDRLRLNFIYATNTLVFNENATVLGASDIRESKLDQSSIAGGIHYEKVWSEHFSSEIAVYETDYKLSAVNANILDNQRFLQTNKVSETGIRLIANNRLNEQLNWSNGYNLVETKVTNLTDVDDPRFVNLEAEVLRTHALFSEMSWSAKKTNTRLNFGLRFNYLTKFKKHLLEPRITFNQPFGDGFNLEILGELKHQNTSQVINFQNDFLGIEKRRWQLSNDTTIPVLQSKQVSLGLSYDRAGWLINIVPYYKRVSGITTQSQGFLDRYEFTRTAGDYDAKGVDLLVRKQLSNSSLWLSYALLSSNYYFDELIENKFPNNFDIPHAVTFGANYTWRQLLLAAGLNWRTGKPLTLPNRDTPITGRVVNFDQANASRQNNYLRVDISAKYPFSIGRKSKTEIGLAVWNILNRKNTINTFFRPNPQEEVQKIEPSSLGITPNVSFKLFFL